MMFGISTIATDEGSAPGALARAIEECGFDSLVAAEHTSVFASSRSQLASSRSASLDGLYP